MKSLLWLLAAFALAAGLSVALRENEGYVLLVAAPWRVELSLNLAIVILVAGFALAYVLVRVIRHTLRLPRTVRAFRERRRREHGFDALVQALQNLIEGRFSRAEKLAARAADAGTAPALAGLVAARAAHRMRNTGQRERWLALARRSAPEWRHATNATEAELLLEERRFEEARALLRELQAGGARHIATLQALLRAEQGMENWEEVARIARLLENRKALPPAASRSLIANACIAMFSRPTLDAAALERTWRTTPAAERRMPRVAAAAARAAMRINACARAHRIIEEALDAEWSAELVRLYGECPEDASLRIARAESWLSGRPRDADLLLTLGQLCMRGELWGKARSYFEASLSLRPARETHLALADLCDRTGRADEANGHYRAAAGVAALA